MNESRNLFAILIIFVTCSNFEVSTLKIARRQRRQFNDYDDYASNEFDNNRDPDFGPFSFGQRPRPEFPVPTNDNSILTRQPQQQQNQFSFDQRRPRPEFSFPNVENPFVRQPQQQQQQTNELIFSNNGQNRRVPGGALGVNSNPTTPAPVVFVNNRPTIATMAPFRTPTTQSPQFLSCFNSCQTTPEYNPICGSNMQLYFNEQKFNCARNCGAEVEIVRRGSCQGLFPMMRG